MEAEESSESNLYKFRSPHFFYVSEVHFISMSIITLGLFNTYWIYKNWNFLKQKQNLEIIPFLRALFGIFYIHSLLNAIAHDKDLNRIELPSFSAFGLATGWVLMNVFGNVLARSENVSFASIGIVVSLSSFLFLLPVQNYIHQVNKTANENLPYSEWSFGQTLCLAIGAPLFALVLIGIFTN